MTANAENLYFLPSGTVEEFNVVIEIPKDSSNKFELCPKTGALLLDRVLYSADHYPFNYGFIPSTKTEDGDALDVAVLLTNSVPPTTVIPCRAVGVIKKIDGGDKDYCIIAVPTVDPRFSDIKDIDDLSSHWLKEVEDFFNTYKRLQNKISTVDGIGNREEAEKEVASYLNNYPTIDTKVKFD